MSRYEIAFSGQLVPGAQLELVKANLAKLFQADAQRIAQLFSGRRIVIKNNLDAAGAEKYRATLERAGARVDVVDMDVLIEEVELAPPPPVEPESAPAAPLAAQAARPGRLQVAPRDEYMAAFFRMPGLMQRHRKSICLSSAWHRSAVIWARPRPQRLHRRPIPHT
jgi:hypothetical protein